MLAELVRNNFINDRVTVNSRERLSRTNIRQASVLYNNTEGPKISQSRPTFKDSLHKMHALSFVIGVIPHPTLFQGPGAGGGGYGSSPC